MFLKSENTKKILFLAILSILTIGGGYYIYACTKYAPWGFSDSATYLASARNLANGDGLGIINPDGSYTPLQIFAPFFSILLSLFAFFQIDLVTTAAIMDIVLFMALIAFGGWFFWKISKSMLSALCFSSLLFFSPALINDFTSIMSEPLAIAFGTIGFLILIDSIVKKSSKWQAVSAILIGLSILTRYAFCAYAAAGWLCLLIFPSIDLRKRFVNSLKFLVISVLPLVIWIAIQYTSTNSLGARHYSVGFSYVEKIQQFFIMVFDVLKYWLPYRTDMIPGVGSELLRPVLLLFFVTVLLLGFIISIKQLNKDQLNRNRSFLFSGLNILMVAYIAMLLLTYSVSTELISIDDRMLSPLLPLFFGLLLTSGLIIDKEIHPKLDLPVLGILITLFFLFYNYHFMRTHPAEIGIYPNGYTSSVWKENPILSGAQPLPQNRVLISNAPDILLFYLHRSSYYLSGNENAKGIDISIHDRERIKSMVEEDCAIIVLFDADAAWRYEQLPHPVNEQDLEDLLITYPPDYSFENTYILSNNCYPD